MNLLSITSHTQYSSAYHDQSSFRESTKSDSNRVSDVKVITGSPAKVRLRITSGSESDFKKDRDKGKKLYQSRSKANAYMAEDDEKEVDYYELSDNENLEEDDSDANHGDETLIESSEQEGFFVGLISWTAQLINVRHVGSHFPSTTNCIIIFGTIVRAKLLKQGIITLSLERSREMRSKLSLFRSFFRKSI